MNRFLLPLLVVCLGFAAWAVFERVDNARLDARVKELEDELSRRPRVPEKREMASAPAPSDGKPKAGTVKTANPAAGAKPGEEGKTMAQGLAKMMENPKMRDAFKAQARMQIGMMYRDLFDLLNLQEPKRSELEKLVTEKSAAAMEIGFSMFGTKKTPEEMKKISDDLSAKIKDSDAKIKALLGEEDFNKLKRYEDSTNERMQLQTFTNMLESANLNLDEATESKLMDIMYDERKNYPFASAFSNQNNLDMARFTPENLAHFNTEYGQLSESIVNRAGSVLTPRQLEVFRNSQEQMTTMVKMHIEMAGQMFGSGGSGSGPAGGEAPPP